MAIKPEAFAAHFGTRETQRDLANRLNEAFDITHGSVHGQLAFWLADPKPHVRDRFGLEREVLVIYCRHQKTDARVQTAIENISRSPDFRHRIDQVLFLLVHTGSEQQAMEIVASDRDRVIVCLPVSELTDPARGNLYVRSKIAGRFGDIDLFGMSSPITSDRYFFGRDELVQEILIRATTKRENTGLFGLRKTGKTSVLRAVQRRVQGLSVLHAYIDCSNTQTCRWWQLLQLIVERLQQSLQARNCQVTIRGDYDASTAGLRFTDDVRSLQQAASGDRILLMLDEIEYITPDLAGALGQHWDEDFLPFWRAVRATHQETEGGLVFVVAGVNPAAVESPRFANQPNPVFQLAPPRFLEPFKRESVRSMVRTIGRYAGIAFHEEVYDYLQQRFGGHPFLIRIACSELWRILDTRDPQTRAPAGIADFHAIDAEVRARLQQPLKDILLSLVWWYPEEYQLLQMIARGDSEFVTAYLSEVDNSLVHFARYGILTNGPSANLAIQELHSFIIEHGEQYQKEISPFTRGDMPPELLPQIPDLATLGKLFEMRVQLEHRMRRIIFMYLGFSNHWDDTRIAKAMLTGLRARSDRKDPSQLFVGRQPKDVINDLYVTDLAKIVTANWDLFAPLFDRNQSRFEMNMDTINLARRADAHTKPVTPQEAADFENSYNWLVRHIDHVPMLEEKH